MLRGLFGGDSGEQEVLKGQSTEGTAQESEAQQITTPPKEKKTSGEKKDMNTIPLEVNVVFSSLPPMSVAEKRASRERLVRLLWVALRLSF
jgi:hypoxia up-regulated 1